MNDRQTMSWSVSALVQAVGDTLRARFSAVQVRGEISSFMRAASGHCYFTLKDEKAQVRCVMFQRVASMLNFHPKDGDDVELQGRFAIYEQRGDLQLIVETMRPVGQGRLLEQFQQLKNKLEQEGLFAASRKHTIKQYPSAIGVVSSLQAAALHDVLTALQRRAPHVPVVVYPASVQGMAATGELVKAIQTASVRQEVDTLLVCRGGGSLEDLWCFNEEAVVRAIAACSASGIPVISGVGHETDFTLADFVADLRAPTPTAAAELAAVPQAELLKHLAQWQQKLSRDIRQRLDASAQRVDIAALTLQHQPAAVLQTQQHRLVQAALRLTAAYKENINQRQQTLENLSRHWPLYVRQNLNQANARLSHLTMRWQQQAPVLQLKDYSERLEKLAVRQRWAVQEQFRQKTAQTDALQQRLKASSEQAMQQTNLHLEQLHARLLALNPQSILARGYAWVTDEQGRVVSSTRQLQAGSDIQAQFADGKVSAQVQQVEPNLLED